MGGASSAGRSSVRQRPRPHRAARLRLQRVRPAVLPPVPAGGAEEAEVQERHRHGQPVGRMKTIDKWIRDLAEQAFEKSRECRPENNWAVTASGEIRPPKWFQMVQIYEAAARSVEDLIATGFVPTVNFETFKQAPVRKRANRYRRYDPYAICERDGWTCHLCGEAIDKTPHRKGNVNHWGASADHLLPQSHGGTDDPNNLKAAHWICNVVRGTKPVPA